MEKNIYTIVQEVEQFKDDNAGLLQTSLENEIAVYTETLSKESVTADL